MAAHLGSGLGVPDLHEVVERPAGDASAVRGEIDGPHKARVTRQRAHLPPATFILEGGPGECRGFLSGRWYQEGLGEFCLGWQKVFLAFLEPDCREHHVQIEES